VCACECVCVCVCVFVCVCVCVCTVSKDSTFAHFGVRSQDSKAVAFVLRTRATHSVHMASSCDTACIRDMLHSYVRYDAFICVTCRNHACDVTWCFHKKNHCLQSVFMCLYLDCVDVSLLLSKRTNRTVRAKQSLCVRIDCNRNLQ